MVYEVLRRGRVRWLGAHLKLVPCSLTAAHHVQLTKAIGPGRPASSHYLFAVRTSIDLGVPAADCEPDLRQERTCVANTAAERAGEADLPMASRLNGLHRPACAWTDGHRARGVRRANGQISDLGTVRGTAAQSHQI